MKKLFVYPIDNRDSYIDAGVFVFNGKPNRENPGAPRVPITHPASQNFVNAIYDEIHAGYGFAPLLGAGFSAPAGIPIIQQLHTYLQRCICIALGVDDDDSPPQERQLWNPRTDRWPPLLDMSRKGREPTWQSLMRQAIENPPRDHPDNSIYKEAYGAMAEWRSSLLFISRLVPAPVRTRKPNGAQGFDDVQVIPRLAEPSQSVIDAGWREWMRDKRPSLNHRLLAVLSGLLRIDVILTTNFDDLVERAFMESQNPLSVFDVRLVDGLPEAQVVTRSRSIVKLHGSTRSLRADYSLDGQPSTDDKRIFAEYLAERSISVEPLSLSEQLDPNAPETKSHLLVFGIAAGEARTMAFVTFALKKLPNLKVFWVCYTAKDVVAIIDYAGQLTSNEKLGRDGKARIYVVRHSDVALLLLHLYQSIRKTIPPAFAVYPSIPQLSMPPLPIDETPLTLEEDKLKTRIMAQISSGFVAVATAPASVSGVTTVCAEIFRDQQLTNVCMWIEMNDIHSVDELFEMIQETAYQRLGQRDWTPLYAAKDNRPRIFEVHRLVEASVYPYLIFINAREQPGANRNFDQKSANGWLDDYKGLVDLGSLLNDFSAAKDGAFRVIILCNDDSSKLSTVPTPFKRRTLVLESKGGSNTGKTIDRVLDWAHDENPKGDANQDKVNFLHTLILMQRARHLSITWARCGGQPADQYWSDIDEQRPTWLSELRDRKLIRWKDGGFIWMHSNLRAQLRDAVLKETRPGWLDCEKRAGIHQSIALWYLKLFDSIGTPAPVFEAVDHLCFSASHLIVASTRGPQDEDTERKATYLIDAKRRIDHARQLLKDNEFLIRTQGFPRASDRRLEHIADCWCKPQWMTRKETDTNDATAIILLNKIENGPLRAHVTGDAGVRRAVAKLQTVTADLRLMIAREIGEDKEGYKCLRILAVRLGSDQEGLTDEAVATTQGNIPRAPGHFHRLVKSCLSEGAPTDRRDEWVRWWLRCGLLGIASRSFSEAEKSLYRAVKATSSENIDYLIIDGELATEDRAPGLRGWTELTKQLGTFTLNIDAPLQSYKVFLAGFYAIQEASNLLILRANIWTRLHSLNQQKSGEANKANDYLKASEHICLYGLVQMENVQSSGFDRPDNDQRLMAAKTRLLQCAGMASRYAPDRKENSRHAMSMMGDAVAALAGADPLFARAEQAVIDLRRAEIRLREAARIQIYPDHEEVRFEAWICDRLHGSSIYHSFTPVEIDTWVCGSFPIVGGVQTTQFDMVEQLKEKWAVGNTPWSDLDVTERELADHRVSWAMDASKLEVLQEKMLEAARTNMTTPTIDPNIDELSEKVRVEDKNDNQTLTEALETLVGVRLGGQKGDLSTFEALREVTSRSFDAIRFLDRAEPIFRERRRNVSWTTCYFELRLRAISFILWAAVVREKTPIPYLGLEAAMRRIESEPDQLLNDAIRMIRVDSYRLALIVLSYASCARALQTRLALDQHAVRLPIRLKQMHKNLSEAISQLEAVSERRNEGSGEDDKAKVNKQVEQVVELALKRARDVRESLPKFKEFVRNPAST